MTAHVLRIVNIFPGVGIHTFPDLAVLCFRGRVTGYTEWFNFSDFM